MARPVIERRQLGSTKLKIAPLAMGGNVFGWGADRSTSFSILDAFYEAGFNTIDTADWYNRFLPDGVGGESETIIGDWMESRGRREQMVIVTKLGLSMGEGMEGLGQRYMRQACEASLRRLKTDYIDVYMAHKSDPETPVEDTLEGFQSLIDSGKIRYAGCSNYSELELSAALAASGSGKARYEVVQPHYNLADRHMFEGAMEGVCQEGGVGVVTYYSLASGFLTGKYRSKKDLEGSRRSRMVSQNLNSRGLDILRVLDLVADRHESTAAQVALAWLISRKSVTAAVVSATSAKQLAEIIESARINLSTSDLYALDAVSAPIV